MYFITSISNASNGLVAIISLPLIELLSKNDVAVTEPVNVVAPVVLIKNGVVPAVPL